MARVTRALISVSDKTGIVDLAAALSQRGIEILSTGGTARLIAEAGIAVRDVSEHTGFPEMMDGRLKTLHPLVHGGLLGRRDVDAAAMQAHGIAPIDLLVVNLYPFEHAVSQPGCDLPTAIENIDIGGPAMLRAAAKNHAFVGVVVDPADHARVLAELDANAGRLGDALRFDLAVKAFEHTARYDGAIANHLGRLAPGGLAEDGAPSAFPRTLSRQFVKREDMRYGENPHQRAAFYAEPTPAEPGIATARQLQGKALSFNNIADTDAALECVKAFETPACVIVKHANPCGVAVGATIREAYERAYRTDPTSAFGGIIAFNRPLDAETAALIIERQFVEVMVAPQVTEEALAATAAKENLRVLSCGQWRERVPSLELRSVNGGLLVQDRDVGAIAEADMRVVSRRAPDGQEMADLGFAWRVVKHVKSNAIVYCRDGMTVGIGAGQMSRVYSARIAAIKAADEGLEVAGSVLASDAFFPFRDGIDAAAEVGVTALVQPGGSVRDKEIVAAADEHGLAMVFTGMRHFRH